jgi:hypothetical protein
MTSGYQGNGTFQFTFLWANDAANGIPITASRMDTEFADATGGFNNVICRDGQSTTSASIPFSQGITITGGSNGTWTGGNLTVPVFLSGTTTHTAGFNSASGFAASGPSIANTANTIVMDVSGGTQPRTYVVGADASTNGTFLLESVRSDGSNILNVILTSNTGAVRFPQYLGGTATFDNSGNITSVSDPSQKIRTGNFSSGLPEILAIANDERFMGTYRWKEESGNETDGEYASFFAYDDFPVSEAVFKSKLTGINSFNDRPVLMACVQAIATLYARIEKLEKVISPSVEQ